MYLNKAIKITGVIIAIFAVLSNSLVLAYLFSPDKHISSTRLKLLIWTIQSFLLLLSLIIFIFAKKIAALLLKNKYFLIYIVYFFSFFLLILFIGGSLVLFLSDQYAFHRTCLLSIIWVTLFFLSFLPLAIALFRKDNKRFIFNNILFLLLTMCTLYSAELTASFFVPKWPVIGLHGINPELGIKAWGRAIEVNSGFNFNSWGQRDRERTNRPKNGVRRIVFVGDSLLEESTIIPFPILTEKKIGSNNIEIINLGVSCSGPEDYYYRIKNIAMPLRAKDCFVFFYIGNDFEDNVKAKAFTFLGIVATYPRDSLFYKFNLKSLNHIITNRYRSALVAWGKSGELHKIEQNYGRLFVSADDDQIKNILMSETKPELRESLKNKLSQNDMSAFYKMLRNPDEKLFRSYYLSFALYNIAGNSENDIPVPDCLPAYEWIKRCYNICNKHNVSFTLVFIPDAFNVDVRMQELWHPLADMKAFRSPIKKACERMKSLCRQDGITYIDLSAALDGKSGTYINPDGHLSQKGADIVSDTLATYIKRQTGLQP